MSQVKINKLQPGGTIPKRGTLTVNGDTYTLEEVNDAISILSPEEQQYMAGMSKALSAGNDWTANSYDNTFTGTGVDDWMAGIFGSKDKADRKLGKNSNFTKTVDATFGNRRDTIRRASSRFFLNLRHRISPEQESTKTEELQELLRGSGWFDTDKDGKYINHASNSRKMKIFDDIVNHFLDSEENRKKKKHDTWSDDYDTILNWINANSNARGYFDNLKNKILSGGKDLDDTDLDILKLFGFDPNRSENVGDPNGLNNFKTKFGIPEGDFNKYFGVDQNGKIVPTAQFFSELNLNPNGNYWFNTAFRKSRDWNDGVLPWLNNIWLVNGNLYKHDDEDLINQLNINNFIAKNKVGDYSGSNAIVNWLWGQNTPSAYDHKYYSPFLQSLNGRYFTQRFYHPTIELQDGESIIKYYKYDDEPDQYGLRKAHAAIINKYGEWVADLDDADLAMLNPYLDDEGNPMGINLYERSTSDKSDTQYYNRYKNEIVDANGNPWITAHIGNEDVVLDVPVGDDQTNSVTRHLGPDESIVIDRKIWDILNQNNGVFWSKLAKDRGLREKFFNTLEALIGNLNRGDNWTWDRHRVLNEDELVSLGIPRAQAEEIVEYIKTINSGVTTGSGGWWISIARSMFPGGFGIGAQNQRESVQRHENNTTRRVQSQKLGGWLPKMQEGGYFGADNFDVRKNDALTVKKFENSTNSKDMLNSEEHWTQADKLDLASTIVDLASMAATFVPGAGNIVGGVGGAAADFMRFSSNVSRDGLDGGDLGNLAVGLGMDALTLVPVVGTGAKAAKFVKNITKVARPLSKAFMAIGAIEAGQAVLDIAENGKFTVEDARKLAMGAQALMGSIHVRKGANAEAELANAINRLVKTEGQEVKAAIKIGNKEIKSLEVDVLKRLSGKKTEEAAKELKSILKEQNSGLVDDDFKNITDASLLERFGFTTTRGKVTKFQNPLKQRAVLPKEKTVNEGDVTGREISWRGNPNHKWANGKVQRVDEFIDENLANAAIRKGLAEQGWFGNTGNISNYARRYFGNRLMAIEPGEDFKVNIKNAPVYKGRDVENIYTEQPKEIKLLPPAPTPEPTPTPVVEPTVEVVNNPILPVLPEAIRPKVIVAPKGPRGFINPSRTVKALPQRGVQRTDLPGIQRVLGTKEQQLSDPNNFGEVLQKLVYTQKFRQLAKTNPAAARQLFEKIKFNYIMHGTTGTPLTRWQEFNGLFFKKGGKVLKGQNDLKLPALNLRPLPFKPKPQQISIGANFELTPVEKLYQDYLKQQNNYLPDVTLSDVTSTSSQRPDTGSESITQGRAGSGMSVNFADLYDRFRALENAKGLNKQYELLDQANRARSLQQFNVPRLNSPKLYTGREKYIADNTAANMMLESTPDIYSDSKLTAATRLSKQSQSEAMRQQGRIAETEAITKQNAANTEVENKNKEREAEAADKRSALFADIESKGLQLKADKQRVLSTKIVDPMLQQFAQQRRDEMNKLDALFQEAQISEKERQANEWMMNELRNNTLYQTWKNSEDYKLDGTDNGYLSWLNANYPDLYKQKKNEAWTKFRIPWIKYDIAKNNRRYWGSSYVNPQEAI